MSDFKAPKKRKTFKTVVIILVILAFIGFIASLNDDSSKTQDNNELNDSKTQMSPTPTDVNLTPTPTATTAESTPAPTKQVATTESYQVELSAGKYVSGMDFPSGKYDLTAVSGSGNVYTSDISLNEVMSSKEDDFSIKTFKNAKLESKLVLTIAGNLVLNISSDKANVADLQPRVNDLTQTVELSSGNYVAGDDFPAGTYNVVAIQGSGNVYTADADLNEVMGTDNDGMSIKEFKNFEFKEGTELTISGVSVNLVPSK
jgi:hypothetical protein